MNKSESLKEFYKTEKGLERKKELASVTNGSGNSFFGKHHTEETKARLRAIAKARPPISSETRRKLSIASSGKRNNFYGKKHPPEIKSIISEMAKKRKATPETRLKSSESHKKLWETSQAYKDQLIRGTIKSQSRLPNRPETIILNLLKLIAPNDWKYTGNGDVVIHRKIPDFWNCNGEKTCILLHGVYWHLLRFQKANPGLTRETVEQKDKDFYKKYGYDTLIIWEDELSNLESVKDKILQFTQKEKEEVKCK